jgi:hypothetical protein
MRRVLNALAVVYAAFIFAAVLAVSIPDVIRYWRENRGSQG